MSHTKILTRSDCYQYLKEQVFVLRPESYSKQHPIWPGQVGIEVEMLPLFSEPSAKPKLFNFNSNPSITETLVKFARETSAKIEWADEDHKKILKIETAQGDNITFEPGGQFEISTKPYACLDQTLSSFRNLQQQLLTAFSEVSTSLVCVGINPWHSLDEIGLQMDKPRYQAMNKHFAQIGPYGQRMMRQTCTIQVNLDFGPTETTLVKRYLGAQLLAPIATAIFANSPIVEQKSSGFKSFRAKIWRHTDPDRTGLIDVHSDWGTLNQEKIIQSYLESVLNAPVVFVTQNNYQTPEKRTTFSDWLTNPIAGVSPTLEDLKVHLSLHFPEVRPKGFLELRSIDGQSKAWQTVPAFFCTGILYDELALDRLLEMLQGSDMQLWMSECLQGLQHSKLSELAQKVMTLAIEGFARLPVCYRSSDCKKSLERYANHFTYQNRTPADDLLDEFHKENGLSNHSLLLLNEKYMKI